MIATKLKWTTPPELLIQKLGDAINKEMRKAMNAGAAPAKAHIQAIAPAKYGYLKKSIIIKVKNYGGGKFKYSPTWTAIIGASSKFKRYKGVITRGPRKGQKRLHEPAHYLHLVDEGTKRAFARKFMTNAMRTARTQFAQIVCDRLRQAIAATGR